MDVASWCFWFPDALNEWRHPLMCCRQCMHQADVSFSKQNTFGRENRREFVLLPGILTTGNNHADNHANCVSTLQSVAFHDRLLLHEHHLPGMCLLSVSNLKIRFNFSINLLSDLCRNDNWLHAICQVSSSTIERQRSHHHCTRYPHSYNPDGNCTNPGNHLKVLWSVWIPVIESIRW